MKMNEESLKAWEQNNIELLTSREMGEWLYRRDMKARANKERMDIEGVAECETCAEEYEQLAEWLKELKELRETMEMIKSTIS